MDDAGSAVSPSADSTPVVGSIFRRKDGGSSEYVTASPASWSNASIAGPTTAVPAGGCSRMDRSASSVASGNTGASLMSLTSTVTSAVSVSEPSLTVTVSA